MKGSEYLWVVVKDIFVDKHVISVLVTPEFF